MELWIANDNLDEPIFVLLQQRVLGQAYRVKFVIPPELFATPYGRRFLAHEICHYRRHIRVVIARTLRKHTRAQLR